MSAICAFILALICAATAQTAPEVRENEQNARKEVSGQVALEGGRAYDILVEYAHDTGNACLFLKWSGPGMDKQLLMPARRE